MAVTVDASRPLALAVLAPVSEKPEPQPIKVPVKMNMADTAAAG